MFPPHQSTEDKRAKLFRSIFKKVSKNNAQGRDNKEETL